VRVGEGALVSGLPNLIRPMCIRYIMCHLSGTDTPSCQTEFVLLTSLEAARRDIARDLGDADPDRVTTAQAADLVTLCAEVERLVSAVRVLFSHRAAQSTRWRDEGHRSAASWMAETSGNGVGHALDALETSSVLATLPETADALRRGELSHSQLKIIAGAAAQNPRTETELLRAAANHSLKGLKETAAAVRAGATSAEQEKARYRAIHAARYARHWADPDGAFRLDATLTPDAGAKLLSALNEEADFRFHEARKAQDHENPSAYSADALVALVTGEPAGPASKDSGPSTAPRATVVIRVDARALRRGYAKAGEMCAIPGVGPVPVAEVRRQLSDAFVKIVVLDGKDVTTVCHVGRSISRHLQTALEERDPVCVVPRCDVAHGLQNHHWDVDYVDCKTSTLDNLARVCWWHHNVITYDGYELTGGPGSWEMRAPPGGCSFETGSPFNDTG